MHGSIRQFIEQRHQPWRSSAARGLLAGHPELLRPDMELLHFLLWDRQVNELARQHILDKRLPRWRRCREVGVERAFHEWEQGWRPRLPPPPTFEVSAELLGRCSDLLEADGIFHTQFLAGLVELWPGES